MLSFVKAYGGAYIAMSSKHLRADFVYAWPTAEIAVMGADGAADILYGKQMKNMNPAEKAAFRSEKIDEYNEKFMNPSIASMHGYVDEIIKPEATRERVYADILMLADKRSIDVIHKNTEISHCKKYQKNPGVCSLAGHRDFLVSTPLSELVCLVHLSPHLPDVLV